MTVRVRFAPSPTGEPHIGNIRTALFDWLLARSSGSGEFILRIEDTDRTRFVPTALDSLYESLRWLGLDWDEGPDIGGPHAPYFQSERLELYQQAANKLIESGQAFHCYCSPERLDEMRNRQRALKQPPHYDGLCRSNEGRQQARLAAGGKQPVVRFKTPDRGETVVNDFLRGEVSFQNQKLDDAVLLKSDGFPTYHLAMPVDDHEMEITHVIRGEEWLPSAPLHKMLFEALGYEMPALIHTPLILGTDRSKLSKRHGAQTVLEYRDQGYLPEAVFNFLGLLGWSLDDKTEIISRDQFVENFSVERLLKSPAVFNLEKLEWMNGEYMRNLSDEDFVRVILPWLEKPEPEGGLPETVQRPLDHSYTLGIVPIVKERIKLASQATAMMDFYYLPAGVGPSADDLLGKAFRDDRARATLLLSETLVLAEQHEDWQPHSLEEAFRALAESLEAKFRDLAGLMRVAITGRSVSPPLFESMEIIGRERCILRLREAVSIL